MKKKGLLSLVLILVLTAFLAACSGGSNTGSDAGPNNAGKNNTGGTPANNAGGDAGAGSDGGSNDTIDEPVTIAITNLGGSSDEKNEENFGKAIKEKFPNVTIQYKGVNKERRIEHLILDGENIDIFVSSIGNFFNVVPQNGLNFDMSGLVEQFDVDLSNVDSAAVDPILANTGGELWAIPVFNSGLVLYYNKTLFDEFGMDYPTDGMTWDEIIELGKNFNVTKDGKDYVGVAISNHHHTKLNAFSLPYVDPETELSTYDDETWKTILNVFVKLGEDPGYKSFMNKKEKPGIADQQDFYDGKAAMFASIINHIGNDAFNNADFDWDLVSYPLYSELPGVVSQAYPNYFGIPPFAQEKEAAMKVIKYLISDEFQLQASKEGKLPISTVPEIQEVFGSQDYGSLNNQAVFYHKYAPVMHKTEYDNDVERAITQYINDLALGNLDVNTALRQAKEQGDQKIAEKKL